MKIKNNNPYRIVVIQHKKSNAVFLIRTKTISTETQLLKTKVSNFNKYRTATNTIENVALKYFCDKYIFFKPIDFTVIYREPGYFAFGDCIRRMHVLADEYRAKGWSVLNGKIK